MANNPYVNKVQLADGTSLIDLTSDTVTADKLMQGYTAHDASGTIITGTAMDGDNLSYGLTDRTSAMVGVGQVGYMEVE